VRWHISRPVQACPRNPIGSNGRLRKDKRQKTNMQKAGVRWARCSGGDTQHPHPLPASLLYTVANKEVEQQFWGWGCDIVVIRNRRNLRSLLSERKHLRKSSYTAFCPRPLLQLRAMPLPACRLFDMAVPMSIHSLRPGCAYALHSLHTLFQSTLHK
jgi:hypothetical protein